MAFINCWACEGFGLTQSKDQEFVAWMPLEDIEKQTNAGCRTCGILLEASRQATDKQNPNPPGYGDVLWRYVDATSGLDRFNVTNHKIDEVPNDDSVEPSHFLYTGFSLFQKPSR